MKYTIDDYLADSESIELYRILKRDFPNIDPVIFFESLISDFNFFKANWADYRKIETYFEKSEFDPEYKNFFLHALLQGLSSEFSEEEVSRGVLGESFKIISIPALKALPKFKVYPKVWLDTVGFDYDKLKLYVDSVSDFKEKKDILIDAKKKCESLFSEAWLFGVVNEFVNKCEEELIKINYQIQKTEDKGSSDESILEGDPVNSFKKKVESPTLINSKQFAENHLKFMSGVNKNNQKIMSDQEYSRMLEYTYYMIENERMPENIKPAGRVDIRSDAITYAYYLIHQKLYGKRKRKYIIEFIHAFFTQFANTDIETTIKKFAYKPKGYDTYLTGDFGD